MTHFRINLKTISVNMGPGHQELINVRQWCRQDLLRGGAKLEIMSWGPHSKLRGQVQQLLDD